MNSVAQFPQADNLELVYKVFIDMTANGLNRYSFAEKYNLSDRQGAYYLNALCFIGLAKKIGKTTYLSSRGKAVQVLDEPFRKKVFLLSIFQNQFICDAYHTCKGKDKAEQKEIMKILIEGTYGITDEATKSRRARTMVSWFRWFGQQEFHIEEKYNV